MAKTLLIGGTGLIGSHLARALLDRGDDLRLTVRDTAGNSAVAQTNEAILIDLSVPEVDGVTMSPSH